MDSYETNYIYAYLSNKNIYIDLHKYKSTETVMKYRYSQWDEEEIKRMLSVAGLINLFNQLLLITNGDVDEALHIMKELQARGLIGEDMDLEAFLEEMKQKNIISPAPEGGYKLTARGEKKLRQDFLHEIFTGLRKSLQGDHKIEISGTGRETLPEIKPYEFGYPLEDLDIKTSIERAMKKGIDEIKLEEDDLCVYETQYNTSCATVLMLDVSHSMVLYGEDRITPAKKVALALSELVLNSYSHDSLNCILFGDNAWEVKIDDLPYVGVGPFHTNTKAGLELAQKILLKKPHGNKQIFMITDGKPSCMFKGGEMYKNSWGLDPQIVNKTLNEAGNCRKNGITIITFMIARDSLLVDFVERMTRINRGRAYFTSPGQLGEYLLVDYMRNRKKKIR